MTQTQKSLAIMILDRGKIFDTSEIKHSQEHTVHSDQGFKVFYIGARCLAS